jgi:hypothetical protein
MQFLLTCLLLFLGPYFSDYPSVEESLLPTISKVGIATIFLPIPDSDTFRQRMRRGGLAAIMNVGR